MCAKKVFLTILCSVVTMCCCAENYDNNYEWERNSMVTNQIVARGIKDPQVISAMKKVKRHLFVPEEFTKMAYYDRPLSIGYGQTISQPYIVALMTDLLAMKGDETILEIGTGSGYQAAVLAEIAKQVFSIEIVEYHAKKSKNLLKKLNYNNIEVKHADGYFGWPDKAPFDGIIITAAPPKLPRSLIGQLKEGGRIVVPEGKYSQYLRVYTKKNNEFKKHDVIPVRFVPMTGEIEKK